MKRRVTRNLTAGVLHECRCEHCRPSVGRLLKTILPVVLTCGLWIVWKSYKEMKAK